MSKLQAPFRVDHVGSFLRPKELVEAKEKFVKGEITREELTAVEDKAIEKLVEQQKKAGLKGFTDGEFRRQYWHLDFFWGLNGVNHTQAKIGYQFHDEITKPDSADVVGKITGENHPFVEHFKFLKQFEDEDFIVKQTIPAPAQFYFELIRDAEHIEQTFSVILLLVKFIVLPNFYEAVSQTSSSKVKVERVKQMELDGSKLSTKFVIRYTLRQLMEGSVLTQTIIAAGILPYLLLIPILLDFSGAPTEISFMNFLNLNTFLPFAMLITFIAGFNTGGNNLLAVGISLERENYYYLKVLPFDMHQFLERKFWILFAIQSIIPVILMTVICTVLRLPIYMTLGIILSWGIISLGLSRWGYARDLKLFTPTWTNVIELLNRMRSGFKSVIFVVVLFGFIFGAVYLLIHLPEWNRTFVWFITIAYVVVILGLSIFATFYYKKKLHELVDSE